MSPTVDASGVSPSLWLYLGALAQRHRDLTRSPLRITSLRRPYDKIPSGHNPPAGELVYSADVRRWLLDELGKTVSFVQGVRQDYGDDLLILMEPEDVSKEEYLRLQLPWPPAPHLHVQLKVKTWPSLL